MILKTFGANKTLSKLLSSSILSNLRRKSFTKKISAIFANFSQIREIKSPQKIQRKKFQKIRHFVKLNLRKKKTVFQNQQNFFNRELSLLY